MLIWWIHFISFSMARRLGQGYSLALKTGEGTHLTLVYFNRLRRGYEQELVKSMSEKYFEQRGLEYLELVHGEIHEKRSICIHGEVENVIKDLQQLFSAYDIDVAQQAHIDPRGLDPSQLPSRVPTKGNWNH